MNISRVKEQPQSYLSLEDSSLSISKSNGEVEEERI
jgi:hypothetical protein